MTHPVSSDLAHVLHELGHYLPEQSPLKDFIHHNTLHAYQHLPFHEGIQIASKNFGYKVYWRLEKYWKLHHAGKINDEILDRIINEHKGTEKLRYWRQLLIHQAPQEFPEPKVGKLRELWRENYNLNLDKEVHNTLFRIVSSYLDQGIAIWKFPSESKGLLSAVRILEKNSFSTFIKSDKSREL